MKSIILLLILVWGLIPTIAYDKEIYETPIEAKAIKLAQAIKHKESGGNYQVKGASGEIGAYQFLPATFYNLSLKHFGTTTPMTPENQDKVAYKSILSLVEAGHDEDDVARYWNSGSTDPKRCRKGINRHGVPYDCPSYVKSVVSIYNSL